MQALPNGNLRALLQVFNLKSGRGIQNAIAVDKFSVRFKWANRSFLVDDSLGCIGICVKVFTGATANLELTREGLLTSKLASDGKSDLFLTSVCR